MRSRMTVRGSEVFEQPALAATVKIRKPDSMVDIQRREILRMRMEEEMRIKTEEDFKRDFLDFSYITGVDEYGLPLATPYAVPHEVSDVYIPADPKTPESASPEEKGPLSSSDSGTESESGNG